MEDATMKTQKLYNEEEEFELETKQDDEDRYVHYNCSIWYN